MRNDEGLATSQFKEEQMNYDEKEQANCAQLFSLGTIL